jgi:hypothetical protein
MAMKDMEVVAVMVVVLVAMAVIALKTTPCLILDTKSFVFLITDNLFYKILWIIPH